MSTYTSEQLAQLDISDILNLHLELRTLHMSRWNASSDHPQNRPYPTTARPNGHRKPIVAAIIDTSNCLDFPKVALSY